MKATPILFTLALLIALPAMGQEQERQRERNRQEREHDREVRVERRVIGPGNAVFISEDGEEIEIDGPHVELIGDGSHYLHLMGPHRQIGVQLTALTPELREHFGVDPHVGVMISRVSEGKPAETAGLLVGDIITAADGEDVDSQSDLVRAIRAKEEGQMVSLEVWRDGRALGVDVGVEEIEPFRTPRFQARSGGDGRKVIVLPELRMRDFHFDEKELERLTEQWDGTTIELDDLQDVMKNLGEYFNSEEWQTRLRQIEEMDLEGVEEKMRAVEERLRKLEEELEDQR